MMLGSTSPSYDRECLQSSCRHPLSFLCILCNEILSIFIPLRLYATLQNCLALSVFLERFCRLSRRVLSLAVASDFPRNGRCRRGENCATAPPAAASISSLHFDRLRSTPSALFYSGNLRRRRPARALTFPLAGACPPPCTQLRMRRELEILQNGHLSKIIGTDLNSR